MPKSFVMSRAHLLVRAPFIMNSKRDQLNSLLQPGGQIELAISQGETDKLNCLLDWLVKTQFLDEFKLNETKLTRFLYVAATTRRPAFFATLLDFGVKMNMQMQRVIQGLFQVNDMKDPLEELTSHGTAVEKLVTCWANCSSYPTAILQTRNGSLLYSAASAGNSQLLGFLLKFAEDHNALSWVLSYTDERDRTLLHAAAASCTVDGPKCLQIILSFAAKHGTFVQLFFADIFGETPLHIATAMQRLESVKIILDSTKAQIYSFLLLCRNNDGYTALTLAAEGSNHEILRAIYDAAIYLNLDTAVQLRATASGLTPFHISARKGNAEVLETLLMIASSSGIDAEHVMQPDPRGKTPLHVAAEKGNVEAVRTIVKFAKARKLGRKLLLADNFGRTPLHFAAACKDVEIFSDILSLAKSSGIGFTFHEKDHSGNTPLSIAFSHGHFGTKFAIASAIAL